MQWNLEALLEAPSSQLLMWKQVININIEHLLDKLNLNIPFHTTRIIARMVKIKKTRVIKQLD